MKLHDYELKGIAVENAEMMLQELKACGQSGDWADSMRHCAGRLTEIADALDAPLHEQHVLESAA